MTERTQTNSISSWCAMLVASWCFNFCYFALLAVISPLIWYRVLVLKKYREGWGAKLFGCVPEFPTKPHGSKTKRVWLHAVSVGEVNLLRPLLRQIAEKQPDWECVISTTSSTGYAVAQKQYGENHAIFFAPLDFSWAVHKAVKRIKPDMLVLAEQEIWPNLVAQCKLCGVKIAVVNGRISEGGFRRYRFIRPLWRKVMRQLDLLCVQSETYSDWFQKLGANPKAVHVTGSLKFDNARTDRENPVTQSLRQLAKIAPDETVFLVGSTQEPEEELAVDAWLALRESHPKLRLILVPRHPERFDCVAQMLDRKIGNSPQHWQHRSRLQIDTVIDENSVEHGRQPILVDTVGELGAWWGTAHIAYVGGSMGTRGGQNMLEPAAYGAAVSFGPKTKNFRDIVSLMLADEAATIVCDGNELTAFVRRCLDDADFAATQGQRARQLVQKHLGATAKTIDLLAGLMPVV